MIPALKRLDPPATQGDPAHAANIRLVIRSIAGLAYLLAGAIVLCVVLRREVPGELWGAFGSLAGVLGGMLVSTRAQGPLGAAAVPVAAAGPAALAGADVDDDEFLDDLVPEVETDAPDDDEPLLLR